MAEPQRLYGMKALVTSAASGVGEAVARTLVKHGATVFAADTKNSGVEQQFAAVKGVLGHTEDLTDAARLPVLIDEVVARLGGIDILVNEFPLQPEAPLRERDTAFEHLLDARAKLILTICKAALPHLKKSPAGRIINTGFLRTAFAVDGAAACATAEKNLADLTRALAAETGEFGITANYVQPGAVMTPVSREVFRKDKALRDHCIASSAARRVGEPVDVAKVVLFLASDDAVFVSGGGIAVDGGRTDV